MMHSCLRIFFTGKTSLFLSSIVLVHSCLFMIYALFGPTIASPPSLISPVGLDVQTSIMNKQPAELNFLTLQNGAVNWNVTKSHLDRLQNKYQNGVNYKKVQCDKNFSTGQNRGFKKFISEPQRISASEPHSTPIFSAHRNSGSHGSAGSNSDLEQFSGLRFQQSYSITEPAIKLFIPTKFKRKSGKIPLFDHEGLLWYGLIQIGNPAKTFKLDFDTGSADLWIPSSNCKSCSNRMTTYNPADSSTSRFMEGVYLDVKYGDGTTTAGKVYKDTVTVGGLTASQQAFAAASHLGQTFGTEPIDGILGLAYRSLSSIDEAPFFQTLMAQNGVNHAVFSFKLSGSDSHFYLGGADRKSYGGNFEWHPVISTSYWIILASAFINGQTAISRIRAIIDTGTSIIVTPPKQALQFWAQVPNSKPHPANDGYFTYPCDQSLAIDFSFGYDDVNSKRWRIPAEDLSLGLTVGDDSSMRCIGAIVGKDVGIDAWILGDTFLKNVYSSFDMENHRVGFANLA